MHFLFIADPLESFNPLKDSTLAMMRAAFARGHRISACEPGDICWRGGLGSGAGVMADVRDLALIDAPADSGAWFDAAQAALRKPMLLRDFSAVLMRKDPPFDLEYFYATHLLEQAEREGAKILNRPGALRDHSEKLALLEFAEFAAPTLVTRRAADIVAFHAQHQDIILKPLDGMGGAGIFRVGADGMNLSSAVELLSDNGARTIMAQKFLPAIAQGDKRILLINGAPAPYSLARIPQGNEVRGNLAAGGMGLAQALTARDLQIATYLGPILQKRGLFLVGLDVIGDCLTEINVTSPTCFQEIFQQTGWNGAEHLVKELELLLI